MASIYRKTALDKISSPEQLDKTITVASPLAWLVVAAVIIMIIGTVLWACFTELPVQKYDVPGMIKDNNTVECFIPMDIKDSVEQTRSEISDTGMVIEIGRNGFTAIHCEVASQPATQADVIETFNSDLENGDNVYADNGMLSRVFGNGPSYKVTYTVDSLITAERNEIVLLRIPTETSKRPIELFLSKFENSN